jgi:hypothetical protein
MDELGAEFNGKLGRRVMVGQDASAYPITRFEHDDGGARPPQLARGGQARRSRADNKDVRESG